jgi:SAM-dependent methyltransferase
MNEHANEKATWRNFSHDYLTEHFGDNEPLAVQQIVQNLFRNNLIPLPRFIVNHLALNGSEDVIDLGCGNGLILREIFPVMRADSRIVGIDLSETMVRLANQACSPAWSDVQVRCMNAYDAVEQFGQQSYDRVMANFIFHYIEAPEKFVAVMAKLLRPDGLAITTIEGRFSMPEMYLLGELAMHRAGLSEAEIRRIPSSRRGVVTAENARQVLSQFFGEVTEVPYHDHLTFTDPSDFVRFYRDGHRCCGIAKVLGDRGEAVLEQVIDIVRAEADRRISEFGFFLLSKKISLFLCRRPRFELV